MQSVLRERQVSTSGRSGLRVICALAGWVMGVSWAEAAIDFWKAPANGVWGDGSRWADGTRPEGGDEAVFDQAGTYTVTFLADPFAIQKLTLTGAAGVTFASNSPFQPSTLAVTSASGSKDVFITNGATLTLGASGGIFNPDRPLHLTVGNELDVENTATLNVSFGSNVAAHVLDVASGGQVNVTGSGSSLTNDTYLTVGTYVPGIAFMTIQNGGAVFNGVSYLGGNEVSTGIVVVTGAGSAWMNSGWLAFGAGSGQMAIQEGGAVTCSSGTLGWLQSRSNGSVGVSGPGSRWTISDYLHIGESGSGQLMISDGGRVANVEGVLGFNPGSSGSATVTGEDSTWTNSGGLHVGQYDSGSLSIEAGGSVSSTFGRVGWSSFSYSSSPTSTTSISGTGSTWTNSGELFIGGYSKGTMAISDGGKVSNTNGSIGFGAAPSSELPNTLLVGNGAVTVTGAGSTWINDGELNVGSQGTGTLLIEKAGSVSSSAGFIGRYADLSHPNSAYRYSSTGTATVTGAGSSWMMSGRLSMGGDATTGVNGGTGTLIIGPGGTVNVAQDTVLFPDGRVKLEGGSLATTEFGFRGGQFQWASGTLHVHHFDGDLTNPPGGTLAPGRSAGGTTIDGSYTQQSGAALEIEIGGTVIATEHDFVNTTGTALLAGELRLRLIDGFRPAGTDIFTVLNAVGGVAGVFSNIASGQRLATIDGRGSFLVHYGPASTLNKNQIVLAGFEAVLITGDFDRDEDVDGDDVAVFQSCFSGPAIPARSDCITGDLDVDGDVDMADFAAFQRCYSGPGQPADPACAS